MILPSICSIRQKSAEYRQKSAEYRSNANRRNTAICIWRAAYMQNPSNILSTDKASYPLGKWAFLSEKKSSIMFTLSIGLTGHSISDEPSIFWWKRRVLIELVYFQRRGAAMQVRQAYIVCAHDITSTCGIPPQLPLLLSSSLPSHSHSTA